jgi:hypothetical protein
MKRAAVVAVAAVLAGGMAWAQDARPEKRPMTVGALKAEIEGLKAPRVAWREIAWKSCLLTGLEESRAKKKPVLLWVFIDRPFDDARC